MKNIITVDLEDWFSVETLQNTYDKKSWPILESVIERNTHKILKILKERDITATFFVLGWIAEKYPALVASVASMGHEIACHSFHHRMVSSLSPKEFKNDTVKAMDSIQNACGAIPIGYRSPSWGMRRDMDWAFEILGELGFKYDSSIYPIRHDIYGDPKSPRSVFNIQLKSGDKIIEIPASTIKFLGARIPVGGGGWLRQFPYWFTRRAIKKLNSENIPAVVYFHPWELDKDVPRVKMSVKNRIRQYGNLAYMPYKIDKLLNDFDFQTIKNYLDSL